ASCPVSPHATGSSSTCSPTTTPSPPANSPTSPSPRPAAPRTGSRTSTAGAYSTGSGTTSGPGRNPGDGPSAPSAARAWRRARVGGKLTGYAHLGPRLAYPVLFWLPNSAREANLHHLLSRTGVPDGLTVGTGTPDIEAAHGAGSGPAGRVWRVTGRAGRVALA